MHYGGSAAEKFKPFMANRVGIIQTKTSPSQWRYMPTKDNPADVALRGSTVKNLLEDKLWWQGPSFIQEGPENWPDNKLKGEVITTEERKGIGKMLSLNVSIRDKGF